jgi:hypothetical protein
MGINKASSAQKLRQACKRNANTLKEIKNLSESEKSFSIFHRKAKAKRADEFSFLPSHLLSRTN